MNVHLPRVAFFFRAFVLLIVCGIANADDWPQWMGPQRDGVWRESGIVEKFPTNGPPVLWRVPVNAGYSGPAVVGNRLFMMDRKQGTPPERKKGDRSIPSVPGNERVICLDATSGKEVWQHTYDSSYRIAYPAGPRTTPVVAEGRVYTLGSMGDLLCLDAASGKVNWKRQFVEEFSVEPPVWGFAAHPLLDGDRLICTVGGSNSAVVAFHKDTGKELWRALSAQEIGYAPPVIYEVGKTRHLIIWHPDALNGLEPETGKVLWSMKYPIEGKPQRPEVTIAMPRVFDGRLFVSSFYQGATVLDLSTGSEDVRVAWNRRSSSKSKFTDGLHTVMCTPVVRDGFIYGVCGMGELRCLDAKMGDRKWESYAVTGGKEGLFANAFFVEHRDRVFVWNDQGELILGKLSPVGFAEISRAKLLETIERTRGRDVLWCHPAFANRCAYVHNGRELICISLAS